MELVIVIQSTAGGEVAVTASLLPAVPLEREMALAVVRSLDETLYNLENQNLICPRPL